MVDRKEKETRHRIVESLHIEIDAGISDVLFAIEASLQSDDSYLRFIALWMDTAAFHCRNEMYWRHRAAIAEGWHTSG